MKFFFIFISSFFTMKVSNKIVALKDIVHLLKYFWRVLFIIAFLFMLLGFEVWKLCHMLTYYFKSLTTSAILPYTF